MMNYRKISSLMMGVVCLVVLALALPHIAWCQPVPGDVNNDGRINRADLSAIVDHILGKVQAPNPDCNQDAAVDIRDVVCLINILSTLPPPDPGDVAPPVDPTVATALGTATEFLYAGQSPIQTGVAPGTIDAKRVAVLRGKVLDRDGNPLPAVTISILNHLEFGQTSSRTDGMFDMAVNGGGRLTINYTRQGYLQAQRQLDVPWQDYVWAPDVVLVQLDPQVTPIDLTSPDPIQVAQGSVLSDGTGTRQATLLFSQSTSAEMVMADGTKQPISTLNIRATEFTFGADKAKTMPAELPPNIAVTYCVELSADESIGVGAKEIQFSKPVLFYLDNFLTGSVGWNIPLGYYDRAAGTWVASDSGRIIKILSINGSGQAELDIDGTGIAAGPSALAALGITDAERERLSTLYPAGKELWRMSIPHFTAWDANWAFAPPSDAVYPDAGARGLGPKDCVDQVTGSIIECQNQALGESIGISGTPHALNYRSSLTAGYKVGNTLQIKLSGASVPQSLIGIEVEISVAGQNHTYSIASGCLCATPQTPIGSPGSGGGGGFVFVPPPPCTNPVDLANRNYTFTWDGKDAYGRPVQGRPPVWVRVGYTYCGVYQRTDRFGYNGNAMITGSRTLETVTLWKSFQTLLGTWDAKGQGLGGWTIDVHHAYDPFEKVLRLGNGGQVSSEGLNLLVIDSMTYNISLPDNNWNDGIPAKQASMIYPEGIAAGPDGSIYIADATMRIRRIGPDGIITTVAGFWTGVQRWGFSGDGGPATQAQLNFPADVALGPDGSIYIADYYNHRIRRVDPNGIITTVAGSGGIDWQNCGYSGDGGPATEARLCQPCSVAVGSDGTLYATDCGNNPRIRRISTDGTITTVVGASYYPQRLALAPDGSLYFLRSNSVRKLGTDGIITTVVNTSGRNCSLPWTSTCGDGGPATLAQLYQPHSIAVGPDGTLYIGDYARIRMVGTDGIIRTIAGRGDSSCSPYSSCGDGGPATQGGVGTEVNGIAVGRDGSLIISDYSYQRIRRVFSALPGYSFGDILIPSRDGSETYLFNSNGRHLRTLNSLTGAILYQFGYDSAGRLTTVSDGDGNITGIERDANGNPTAIVAPFGQRTTLSLDANGYLSRIANPANESVQFSYTNDGLLTTLTDPRGKIHRFTYDNQGRLLEDEDPAGGSKNLTRTEMSNGYEVTLATGMNRVTKYLLEQLPAGEEHRVKTLTDGLILDTLTKTDGTSKTTFPNGTTIDDALGPNPRFGMQAPLPSKVKVSTPGGLTYDFSETQTVTLTDPNNPLSLSTLNEEATINGRKYTTNYTAATKTFTATSPAGRQGTAKIDDRGRIVEVQVPGLLPFQLAYDTHGRLTSVKQGSGPDLRESTFQYNAQGLLQTATDPLSQALSVEYDQAGRVTRIVLPDSREITYAYDANGNSINITPPGRPAHELEFTPVGLLQAYRSPDGGAGTDASLFAWNADRDLTQSNRPEGGVSARTYDAAGRLSSLTFSGGTVTYGYQVGTGQLGTIAGPGGVDLAFTYDGLFLTAETWSGAVVGTVQHTYDNDFRVISQDVNGGGAITFGYDSDGLLTSAGNLVLTRDAQNGFVTGTTIGNVTETRSYNTFAEMVNCTVRYAGNDIFREQFTYDKLGRIVQKIETQSGVTATYQYTYDLAGRLTEVKKNGATASTYTYDSNDNRLTYTGLGGTIDATYDVRDRLLQYGSTTFGYSASGERLSKTNGSQTTAYTYDVLGNLVQVALPDSTQVEYVLDGLGRRVGKRVNGSLVQRFLYQDDLMPVAELDGAGVLVSRFIYGSRLNVPDYMVKGGSTYRIISDHLGSPRLVVNTSTGLVEQQMEYDEFGNVIQDSNPGFQPFGFAGGIYDRDTELVRFGARDYDAEAGQWTTRDPILFLSGRINLYAYVGNDPVNLIDPTGLQWLGPLLGFCSRPPIGPRITPAMRALRAMERTGNEEGLMKATEQGMKASGRRGLGQTAENAGKQAGKAAADNIDRGVRPVPRGSPPPGYDAWKTIAEQWRRMPDNPIKEAVKKAIENMPKDIFWRLLEEYPWLSDFMSAPPVMPEEIEHERLPWEQCHNCPEYS